MDDPLEETVKGKRKFYVICYILQAKDEKSFDKNSTQINRMD